MLARSVIRPGSRLIRASARGNVLPATVSSDFRSFWYDFRSFSAQPKGQEVEMKEKPVDAAVTKKKASKKAAEDLPVDFSDISRANVAIRGGVRRTDCTKSYFLSELTGMNIFLKPEFQQFTGSFKERGARNAILQLMREKGSSLTGVIAASAGNHALALAYHGKLLGIPVTVVMPTVAPLAKVDKCRVSRIKFLVLLYRNLEANNGAFV
jgi:threonine dehydratase